MKRIAGFIGLTFLLVTVSGAAAQRPDAPSFAQRGPYTVGTRELHLEDGERILKVTVWYPAENPDELDEAITYRDGLLVVDGHALADAPPDQSDAPYPLVVFSHGNAGTRLQSTYFVEHLASRGFVVLAADHTGNTLSERLGEEDALIDGFILNISERPRDVIRLIDFADTDPELSVLVNTERVAVTGHSMGGWTAVGLAGGQLNFPDLDSYCADIAETIEQGVCFMQGYADEISAAYGAENADDSLPPISDSRVTALVMMAPWGAPLFDPASLAAVDVPSLVLVGSLDETAPAPRDANVYFEQFGGQPRALVTFQNGGHTIFVDECSEFAAALGLYSLCSDAVWDLPRVHDLTNHLATAFLTAILYDDPAAWEALDANHVNFPGVDYDYIGE